MSRQAKVIITSTNNAGAGIKAAVKDLVSLESNAVRVAQGIQNALSATAVIALAKKMVDFGVDSVKAFGEVERATIQLRTALGGSSEAVDRMNDLIGELSSKSLASKGDIRDLVADLAALGKSEDEIRRIADAAVNLSNVTGQGLNEAMKQVNATFSGSTDELGKLIPEIKGLTKEQLAAGGAADIINEKLGALSEEMAGGVTQQMKNLSDSFGTLRENIGERMLTAFTPMVSFIQEIVDGWNDAYEAQKKYTDALARNDVEMAAAVKRVNDLKKQIDELKRRQEAAAQDATGILSAIDTGQLEALERAYAGALRALKELENKRSGSSGITPAPSTPAAPKPSGSKGTGLPSPAELAETESGISAVTAAWAKMGNMIDYALEGEVSQVEVAGVFEQGWTMALENIAAKQQDWASFTADSVGVLFNAIGSGLETVGQALYNGESGWDSFGAIAVEALSQILRALGAQLAAFAVYYALLGKWGKAGIAAAGAAAAFIAAGVASAWAADLSASGGGSESPQGNVDSDAPGGGPSSSAGASYTGSQPITFNFYNQGNVVGSGGLEELALLIDSILKRNARYA